MEVIKWNSISKRNGTVSTRGMKKFEMGQYQEAEWKKVSANGIKISTSGIEMD